jgi:hypothetical protein
MRGLLARSVHRRARDAAIPPFMAARPPRIDVLELFLAYRSIGSA